MQEKYYLKQTKKPLGCRSSSFTDRTNLAWIALYIWMCMIIFMKYRKCVKFESYDYSKKNKFETICIPA